MPSKPKRSVYLSFKITAIFLSISLILSESLSYAAVLPKALAAPQSEVKASLGSELILPSELGMVESSWKGTNGKTIIYIQDAHASLEAQVNIAKMIHYAVENYDAQTVFEEGYEGTVPTDDFFGSIQDAEVKEKASYFLMDKLRLGGAEYAHINRKKEFKLMGADNLQGHKKNVEWAQEHSKNRTAIKKDLAALKVEFEKLAQTYFPSALKEWLRLKDRYAHDKISLLDYLQRAMNLFPKTHVRRERNYPEIQVLLNVGASNDPETAKNIELIEPKKIFKQLGELENDLAKNYLKEEKDIQIFSYLNLLGIFERLNELKIVPDEYEVIQSEIRSLNTQEMANFIARHAHSTVVLSKKWESSIESAIQFYETSKTRDAAIAKRLESFAEQKNEKVAVLVFGGFHKKPIERILRENGFSYFIVAPKMSALDQRHEQYYNRLMSEGYHSFETPFALLKASRPENIFELGLIQTEPYRTALIQAIEANSNTPLNILLPTLGKQLARFTQNDNTAPKPLALSETRARKAIEFSLPAKVKVIQESFPVMTQKEFQKLPRSLTMRYSDHVSTISYPLVINGKEYSIGEGKFLRFIFPNGDEATLYDNHNLFYGIFEEFHERDRDFNDHPEIFVHYDEHSDDMEFLREGVSGSDKTQIIAQLRNFIRNEGWFAASQIFNIANFLDGLINHNRRFNPRDWRRKWVKHNRTPDDVGGMFSEVEDFDSFSGVSGGIASVDLDMIVRGKGKVSPDQAWKFYQSDKSRFVDQLPAYRLTSFFISDSRYINSSAALQIFADLFPKVAAKKLGKRLPKSRTRSETRNNIDEAYYKATSDRNLFRAITEDYKSPDFSQYFHTVEMRMGNSEIGSQTAYDWYVASLPTGLLERQPASKALTLKEIMEYLLNRQGEIHWVDLGAGLNYAQDQLLTDPQFSEIAAKSTLTAIDLNPDIRMPRVIKQPIRYIQGDMRTVEIPSGVNLVTQVHNTIDLEDPLENLVRWTNGLREGGIYLILGAGMIADGDDERTHRAFEVEELTDLQIYQDLEQSGVLVGERSTHLLDLEEVPYPYLMKYQSFAIQKRPGQILVLNAERTGKRQYRKLNPEQPLLIWQTARSEVRAQIEEALDAEIRENFIPFPDVSIAISSHALQSWLRTISRRDPVALAEAKRSIKDPESYMVRMGQATVESLRGYVSSEDTVLDIGSGPKGGFAFIFALLGAQVTSFEIDSKAVVALREKYEKLKPVIELAGGSWEIIEGDFSNPEDKAKLQNRKFSHIVASDVVVIGGLLVKDSLAKESIPAWEPEKVEAILNGIVEFKSSDAGLLVFGTPVVLVGVRPPFIDGLIRQIAEEKELTPNNPAPISLPFSWGARTGHLVPFVAPFRSETRSDISADEARVRPMFREKKGVITVLAEDFQELLELYPLTPAKAKIEKWLKANEQFVEASQINQLGILFYNADIEETARAALEFFYEHTVLAELTLPATVEVQVKTFDAIPKSKIYTNLEWDEYELAAQVKIDNHLSNNSYRVKINGQDYVFGKGTYLEFSYPDGSSDFLYDYHNIFYAFAALKAEKIQNRRYVLYDDHSDVNKADPVDIEGEDPFERAQLYTIANFHHGVLADSLRKSEGWRWSWITHLWRDPEAEERRFFDEIVDFDQYQPTKTGGIAGVDLDIISRGTGLQMSHRDTMKLHQGDREKLVEQLSDFESRAFFISDDNFIKPSAALQIFADLYPQVAAKRLEKINRAETRGKLTKDGLIQFIDEHFRGYGFDVGGDEKTGFAVSTENRSNHSALRDLEGRLAAIYPDYQYSVHHDPRNDPNFMRLDIIPPASAQKRSEVRAKKMLAPVLEAKFFQEPLGKVIYPTLTGEEQKAFLEQAKDWKFFDQFPTKIGSDNMLILYVDGRPAGAYAFEEGNFKKIWGLGIFISEDLRRNHYGSYLRDKLYLYLQKSGAKVFLVGAPRGNGLNGIHQNIPAQAFQRSLIANAPTIIRHTRHYPDSKQMRGLVVDLQRYETPEALLDLNLDAHESIRSEVREVILKSENLRARGTFLISADDLVALTPDQQDELVKVMKVSRSEVRLVIHDDRGQIPLTPALSALLKLDNTFFSGKSAEKAYQQYAIPRSPGIHLFAEKGLRENQGRSEARFLKAIRLKNEVGRIAFGRLLILNGGQLPGVDGTKDVIEPSQGILGVIQEDFLSQLVIAYAA